jgi:hypothetical protein
MDWLQTSANIVQVVGVLWVLLLGGKTVWEVTKLIRRQRVPIPPFLWQVIATILILTLLLVSIYFRSGGNGSQITPPLTTIPSEPCLTNLGVVIHTESSFLCLSEKTGTIPLDGLRLNDVTSIYTGKYQLRIAYTKKNSTTEKAFPDSDRFVCSGKTLPFSPPITPKHLNVSDENADTCDPSIGT